MTPLHLGNPRSMVRLVVLSAFGLLVFLALGGYYAIGTVVYASSDHVGPTVIGALVSAAMIAFAVVGFGLLVKGVRHHQLLGTVVTVTDTEVVLPRSVVRVASITGVACLQAGGRSVGWRLCLFLQDGTRAMAGGFGADTKATTCEGSQIAAVAKALCTRVLEQQGPAGPLASVAQQTHPSRGLYGSWKRLWDPVSGDVLDLRVAPPL